MQLPKIPFSTSIRSYSEMNIKACFLHQLDEFNQIIPLLKVILHNKKNPQKNPTEKITEVQEKRAEVIEERNEFKRAYLTGRRLMAIPENIGLDYI